MFNTHVCVDVPFSNSIGIALENRFDYLAHVIGTLPFNNIRIICTQILDSKMTLSKHTNIYTY